MLEWAWTIEWLDFPHAETLWEKTTKIIDCVATKVIWLRTKHTWDNEDTLGI